jgi:hypothetical protein
VKGCCEVFAVGLISVLVLEIMIKEAVEVEFVGRGTFSVRAPAVSQDLGSHGRRIESRRGAG